MRYKRQPRSQYSRKNRGRGSIEHPKGTKPIVVEVKTGTSEKPFFSNNRFGLGYEKEADIEKLQSEFTRQIRKELSQDRKADVTFNFPKSHKKPVQFSVVGEQPVKPPVIVHASGWNPPEQLIRDAEKMVAKKNRETASDVEALAYMYGASMTAPFNSQGYRIYNYLTRKYLKSKGWKSFKGDMNFLNQYKTLSDYDRRELNKLKTRIFKDQQKVLRERRKRARQLKGNRNG